jgi:hypothetical protein
MGAILATFNQIPKDVADGKSTAAVQSQVRSEVQKLVDSQRRAGVKSDFQLPSSIAT